MTAKGSRRLVLGVVCGSIIALVVYLIVSHSMDVMADAILQALLHKVVLMSIYDMMRIFIIIVFIMGIIGSLIAPLFFQLWEELPRVKARRRAETNVNLQLKYDAAFKRLIVAEKQIESAEKRADLAERLLREERSHNHNWNIRTDQSLREEKKG
jgi:hypothetical protein